MSPCGGLAGCAAALSDTISGSTHARNAIATATAIHWRRVRGCTPSRYGTATQTPASATNQSSAALMTPSGWILRLLVQGAPAKSYGRAGRRHPDVAESALSVIAAVTQRSPFPS